MKKLFFNAILLLAGVTTAGAQSGTNSPYSQYGLGILSEQAQGFNRGMNGLGLAFRNGHEVNMLNPASYSAADSLTMVLDVGASGQLTNFKEGNTKVNAKNANFEYAVALFRVMPRLGVSLGIVPFTNVGYSYSSTDVVSSSLYSVITHSGSGGLREVYIGTGWEPFKGLSVGVNVGYLWGDLTRSITNTTNQSAANTLSRIYSASISSYKLDFGAQYQQALSKNDVLTIGATFGLGHKMNGDALLINANTDTQNSVSTQDTATIANAFKLPMTVGVGLALCHNNSLTVGADYSLQRWSSIDYPQFTGSEYKLTSGLLSDRHKMTVGLDWIPSASANWTGLNLKNLLSHTHYRMGVSYATPYYKVNGQNGPKELSVSAGMGVPLVNKWGNRSVLNVSVQWARQSATNLITENTFRINLGITFNERWFAKWKVE